MPPRLRPGTPRWNRPSWMRWARVWRPRERPLRQAGLGPVEGATDVGRSPLRSPYEVAGPPESGAEGPRRRGRRPRQPGPRPARPRSARAPTAPAELAAAWMGPSRLRRTVPPSSGTGTVGTAPKLCDSCQRQVPGRVDRRSVRMRTCAGHSWSPMARRPVLGWPLLALPSTSRSSTRRGNRRVTRHDVAIVRVVAAVARAGPRSSFVRPPGGRPAASPGRRWALGDGPPARPMVHIVGRGRPASFVAAVGARRMARDPAVRCFVPSAG